jgi:hypothetical protein
VCINDQVRARAMVVSPTKRTHTHTHTRGGLQSPRAARRVAVVGSEPNMDKQARLFWTLWIVAFVAVIVGRFVDWLNVGAMAGAIALLIALAATYPRRR